MLDLIQMLFLPFILIILPIVLLLIIKKPIGGNRYGRTPSQMISFIEAIKSAFVKVLDFNGRSSRSEFWYYFIFSFICNNLINLIVLQTDIVLLSWLSLLLLMPYLSVAVRRLHDVNRSGWWLFSGFVAVYLWAQPSQDDQKAIEQVF